jgi:betaine reductase
VNDAVTPFQPVIGCASYCLVHAPELVRYGSKPRREIASDPAFERSLSVALRDFSAAEHYAPNLAFTGHLPPEGLAQLPRPWFAPPGDTAAPATHAGVTPAAPFGEILPQAAFYSLLKRADVLEPPLVEIGAGHAGRIEASLGGHPIAGRLAARDLEPLETALIAAKLHRGTALPLILDGEIAGLVSGDERAEGRDDANLDAHTLLEALCTKATAALALEWLLERHGIGPQDIDYVISCGEEASGDRYQRGGGGMAKAVGEMCGCVNASGMDIKNFCAAPANALVTAGALVAAGVHERVAVVAGGSLAKLGMKSQAFIAGGLPILDDCLAAHAFLVTRDDGVSPVLHLEPGAIGMASIGASTADEAVYRQLLIEPLDALGLKMTDIDKYAPELHNPEIMEHSGSGDVAHKNYRMIAAMAVRAGAIEKAGMQAFIDRIGMPGFAPTQGHIPSGVAYIGHALDALQRGRLQRVMILSKASLFLNRLTGLYDGVSFVLEANPKSSLNS